MLGFLKAFFLVLLYIFVILLVLLLLAAIFFLPIVFFDGWGLWHSVYLVGGLVGGIIAIIWLRRWLVRRREAKFVKQMIEQDEASMADKSEREREKGVGFQRSWEEAINTLRRSALARHGNPLYVLPWYLMLGEAGSGKSTAAQRSKLAAALNRTGVTARLSATRDLEWWLFDDAIILDAAGRYASGPQFDELEWDAFMTTLAKYRTKEPLNGVVLTVSADRLAMGNQDDLNEYGKSLRNRIDGLARVLGHRFPVYVMVTKLDKLPGMAELAELLPEEIRSQALGLVNEQVNVNPDAFVEDLFQTVGEQMRNLRMILLHNKKRSISPNLLVYPTELERLRAGMLAFVRGVFHENPYQVEPILRGIYLSSATQDGAPLPRQSRAVGVTTTAPPPADQPMFLADFFRRILPHDRQLFLPVPEYLRFRNARHWLKVAIWMGVCLGACALLVLSAMSVKANLDWFDTGLTQYNKKEIDRIDDQYNSEYLKELEVLGLAYNNIRRLEERNGTLWYQKLPFVFNQSAEVEAVAKQQFAKLFNGSLQNPIRAQIINQLPSLRQVQTKPGMTQAEQELETEKAFAILGAYFEYLVQATTATRVAATDGVTLDSFGPDKVTAPQGSLLTVLDPALPGKYREYYPLYFKASLAWNPDRVGLDAEATQMHKTLATFFYEDPFRMQWLVAWADYSGREDVRPVTLADFWGPPPAVQANQQDPRLLPYVHAANTTAGRALVKDMLEKQFHAALIDPRLSADQQSQYQSDYESRTQQFLTWYKKQAYADWLDFAANFHQGRTRVASNTALQSVTIDAAQLQGPYMNFINFMRPEVEVWDSFNNRPTWVKLLRRMKETQDASADLVQDIAGSGFMKTLGAFSAKVLSKVSPKANKAASIAGRSGGGNLVESSFQPSTYFQQYRKGLLSVKPVPGMNQTSYQKSHEWLTDLFAPGQQSQQPQGIPGQQQEDKASFGTGFDGFNNMKQAIVDRYGYNGNEDQIIWSLYEGPLSLSIYYHSYATGRYLQEEWVKDVAGPVRNMPTSQKPLQLFGKEQGQGLVWAFVTKQGKAAPFLQPAPDGGFQVKKVNGQQVPFTQGFVPFLNKGAFGNWGVKKEYNITVHGLPVDVNRRAIERPYLVSVKLNLPTEVVKLENYNYPTQQTFTWKPDDGGDVELQIKFGAFTLTKYYAGKYAFVEFVRDFQRGSKTFVPADFPEQEKALSDLYVDRIVVKFLFRNLDQVQELLRFSEISDIEVVEDITKNYIQLYQEANQGTTANRAAPAAPKQPTGTVLQNQGGEVSPMLPVRREIILRPPPGSY